MPETSMMLTFVCQRNKKFGGKSMQHSDTEDRRRYILNQHISRHSASFSINSDQHMSDTINAHPVAE
jgi:hypothetical protein